MSATNPTIGVTKDEWNILLRDFPEGKPAGPEFNNELATTLLLFSTLAYKAPQASPFEQSTPFQSIFFQQPGTAIQAYLFIFEEHVVLTFRGSELPFDTPIRECVDDWANNLGGVTLTTGPLVGKCHKRYLEELKMNLYLRIEEYLTTNDKTKNKHLYVTGHSQGGALALMFLAEFMQTHALASRSIQAAYVFAAPKIGDADFTTAINSLAEERNIYIFRVTNHHDLVPHLPPAEFGYSQGPGVQVHFNDKISAPIINHPPQPFSTTRILAGITLGDLVYHYPAGPTFRYRERNWRPGYLQRLLDEADDIAPPPLSAVGLQAREFVENIAPFLDIVIAPLVMLSGFGYGLLLGNNQTAQHLLHGRVANGVANFLDATVSPVLRPTMDTVVDTSFQIGHTIGLI